MKLVSALDIEKHVIHNTHTVRCLEWEKEHYAHTTHTVRCFEWEKEHYVHKTHTVRSPECAQAQSGKSIAHVLS